MAERADFTRNRKPVTFVDLFAGAGGISEGFLQACTDSKYYDFVLASDINENCELTHRARYNEQLGLGTKFVTEDIMSPTFVTDLQKALEGKEVDVVTGGPSCQSFSLSGRRMRFDKRDGLFSHYLKVIRALRPKYFVMENVKGLLTKDKGRFKMEIMREMRSIIDNKGVPAFMRFAGNLLKTCVSPFFAEVFTQKLLIEISEEDTDAVAWKEKFFDSLDAQLKRVTREIEYRISKSNKDINTIRHGLALLRHNEVRERIMADIINEKTAANIDNDWFVDKINEFLTSMSDEEITTRVICSFDLVEDLKKEDGDIMDLKNAIRLYSLSLDECLDELGRMAKEKKKKKDFDQLMKTLRLYNVEQMVLLSSDYGVPQNRERVVFIGSRNDQEPIKTIPATVHTDEKVTVYEAISDLDFIGNGEVRTSYMPAKPHTEWDCLIRRRKIDGEVSKEKDAKTFAEWSREGRLSHRFTFDRQPFYVKNMEDFWGKMNLETAELFNHQTSAQNDKVQQRLKIIAECGGYTDECKKKLKDMGLESNKRNYFVLKADGQSPTVVTMPDDFIHYARHRAMTVREMARLQSFDDSFVFQGKRQTGGDKRKSEIPQYTLVGNAVPPLMSRAIGNEILKHIV